MVYAGWRNQFTSLETGKKRAKKLTRVCVGCGGGLISKIAKRCGPCAAEKRKEQLAATQRRRSKKSTVVSVSA